MRYAAFFFLLYVRLVFVTLLLVANFSFEQLFHSHRYLGIQTRVRKAVDVGCGTKLRNEKDNLANAYQYRILKACGREDDE